MWCGGKNERREALQRSGSFVIYSSFVIYGSFIIYDSFVIYGLVTICKSFAALESHFFGSKSEQHHFFQMVVCEVHAKSHCKLSIAVLLSCDWPTMKSCDLILRCNLKMFDSMEVIRKCSSERCFWNSISKDTSFSNWQCIDSRIINFRAVDLS